MDEKKYTHEEILNALTVIKKICSNHRCSDCPLLVGGMCKFNSSENPCDWVLNLPDAVWRAFC